MATDAYSEDEIHETAGSDIDPLLSIKRTCEILDVSPATFYRMAGRGEIETVWMNKSRKAKSSCVRRLAKHGTRRGVPF